MTHGKQRTLIAERVAAEFSSIPLVWECVFPNPKYLDKTEKEVCDLILALKSTAILVQIKAQEDPESRPSKKLEAWVIKKARKALSQLQGAIKTVYSKKFWCNHPRRGKVEFTPRQLHIVEGIVVVELAQDPNTRLKLPGDFLLSSQSTPISYFSLSDFLNVINEFRSFPELIEYLAWRQCLSEDLRRACGGEKTLLEYYLLVEGISNQAGSYEMLQSAVVSNASSIRDRLKNLHSHSEAISLIEDVTSQLSARSNTYFKDLSPELVELYEPTASRKGYLRMQEELCDLRLPERKALGTQFLKVIRAVQQSPQPGEFRYCANYFDSKPDFLYVFASSREIRREEVVKRGLALLRGGLSFYRKNNGLAIVDRDGKSYEILLLKNFSPSVHDRKRGDELFAHVKIQTVPATLTNLDLG